MSMTADPPRRTPRASRWCALALMGCAGVVFAQANLAAKAKETGCIDKPQRLAGSDTFKCSQGNGAQAFFNVPGAELPAASPTKAAPKSAPGAAPAAFPRIDAGTQRSRDDLRRKVLADELANEEKMLAEARVAYADGAPPSSPDEKAQPQKYADRIAKLRQAVQLHERNIEALKREMGTR
jgi:hypothetical protein